MIASESGCMPVPGYEGRYLVTSDGFVLSECKAKIKMFHFCSIYCFVFLIIVFVMIVQAVLLIYFNRHV